MRTPPVAPALLAALLAGACASSPWQRTERFSADGAEGRLYVPKVYAPLLPGSIYPDRKNPVPAKGRPAIVVVCPGTGNCCRDEILEQAGRRGMVVLILRRPPSGPLTNDLLRTRAEASGERTGWLLVAPTEDLLGKWIGGLAPGSVAAVLGPPRAFAPPPAPEAPLPSSPSKQIPLLFSFLVSDGQPQIPDAAILKLYAARPSGGLPPEAFRDAVEWLAGALRSR